MSYLRRSALAAAMLFCGSGAMAAPEAYMVNMGPVARTNATHFTAVGRGIADVTIDGNKLSIKGTFGGLASPATDAHVCQGVGIGVQGNCSTDLTVDKATWATYLRQSHAELQAAAGAQGRAALYRAQQREGACARRQSLGLAPDRP